MGINKCGCLSQQISSKDLLKKLGAIKYVCTFDLANEFPPATLLEGYLCCEEVAAEEGQHSLKAQGLGLDKELNALRAVTTCAIQYKLEPVYPVNNFIARIDQVQKLRSELGNTAPSSAQEQDRFNSPTEDINAKKRKYVVPYNRNNPQRQPPQAAKLPRPSVPQFSYQQPPRGVYPSRPGPFIIRQVGNYYRPVQSTSLYPYMRPHSPQTQIYRPNDNSTYLDPRPSRNPYYSPIRDDLDRRQ